MNPPTFPKSESASGLVLFVAAILALLIANSPWNQSYKHILTTTASNLSVNLVINEGLMAIFFLVVTLELKREILEGQLSSIKKVMLPGLSALAGMLAPALIFLALNVSHPENRGGWPIPVATDIAFALGVLSLFGKRLPLSLKLFLMALAVIDDLGAILIVAFSHLKNLSATWLLASTLIFGLLVLLNYYRVERLSIFMVIGLVLWSCILKSGIHTTIAGVLLACTIPLKTPRKPLMMLENGLSPWVAFLIMPLFAFANAGVTFNNLGTIDTPLVLGIILGLFFGKQVGIFGCCALMIKLKWAERPHQSTYLMLYGASLLSGIGFTMSLFMGTLVFSDPETLAQIRLAVMSASLLSGLTGSVVLWFACKP